MLYSEFVEGTGCKQNEHNYKVYKDLEVMYMNSDMTKAEIYEYGKKLVDNSKSEEQMKLEAQINEEIEFHKSEIKRYQGYVKDDQWYMNYWKEQGDKEMTAFYRNNVKSFKGEIKEHRRQIAALKWVLE